MTRGKNGCFQWAFLALVAGIIVLAGSPTQAEWVAGKTYDKSNYQEIQDMLNPPLLNWIKKGEFIIQTNKLEFELKPGDDFIEASRKNEGKFDVDKNGVLVDKKTGKPAEFFTGYPFPKIDPKDPKAGEKILENANALRFRTGGFGATGRVSWIGTRGLERQVIAAGNYLYYQNRRRGPLPNPNNFLQQQIVFVVEPFDLRGSATMSWTYNDTREDTSFAYVPMIRRIRRVSAANRSDPFLGSDLCTDDAYTWVGKNASMRWKLIGQKTLLMPLSSSKKILIKSSPDGSIEREFIYIKKGYEVPGWKGAPWAPVNLIWTPRPVWIVEGNPKDPYYNYGRQIFYVDQVTFLSYFKEVFDKAGQYWKSIFVSNAYQVTDKGVDIMENADFYAAIDDKTHHASTADVIKYKERDYRVNLPPELVGPQHFTESFLLQVSK
jgi:hypothetical protein